MNSQAPDIKGKHTFNSSSSISDLCTQIIGKLDTKTFTSDDIFALHIAIEEACINAVKHGNKNDPQKKVVIEYSLSSSMLDVVVEDEGLGFTPSNVPDPREDENLCKTSGRGLLLIKAYMDVVEHNSRGNRLHMIKYATNRK